MQNNDDKLNELYNQTLAINRRVKEQLQNAESKGENVPESVWADGVPENIKESDKVPNDEILSMAVDYIMKNVVIAKGFKIEPGFPRPEFPNIICKRDGIKYSIVIAPCVYPSFVTIDDKSRIDYVKNCKANNLIPLSAAVGYRSYDEERAKARLLLKGDLFITTFPGFIVLGDGKTQTFNINEAEMFRP